MGNKEFPAGWGGVGGHLVLNDTTICSTVAMSYSTAAVLILSNSATGNCGSGVYSTLAAFDIWNGSSYTRFGQAAPYQNK